ncbi:hypothetical protein AA0115_g7566 [Alternaria tenuissima]|uniref:Transcription activator GCR1-like domain-containing protein n=1 Tax=Alternaria tenuissima TaxID=119927 RepID=A0AB37WFR8_9PLEO|nr:hypothetical protein AA0115_g7566 [Alternaria tenuissima]
MTPCEKRVCCEITEAYKPWVKDGGVKWLFRDAYTRVGGRWDIWSKKDMNAIKCSRLRAVEAARKGTRNTTDSSEDRCELQQKFQQIGVPPAAYFA